jgi:hypothetical protein
MRLICQAFSSAQDIARFSSVFLVLVCAIGCQQDSEPVSQLDRDRTSTSNNSTAAPVGIVVEIDQAGLPKELPDTALLFVYIREPGKRMPIAVEYFAMTDIPAKIPFFWSDKHTPVEVIARISPAGQVERRDADIEKTTAAASNHPPNHVYISFAQADVSVSRASKMRNAAKRQFLVSDLHDQLTLSGAGTP